MGLICAIQRVMSTGCSVAARCCSLEVIPPRGNPLFRPPPLPVCAAFPEGFRSSAISDGVGSIRADFVSAGELELVHTTRQLVPAKHLFSSVAGVDRLDLTLMTGGEPDHGRNSLPDGILHHTRCSADAPHLGEPSAVVVVLVTTSGLLVCTGDVSLQ